MLEQFGLVETNASIVAVGDRCGRLEVLAVGQIAGTYRYYAVCQCDCGSSAKRIRSEHIKSGKTQSCGCLQRERSTTHGVTKTGHLSRWRAMMTRCYDEQYERYADYGGRGIKVCDRWHDPAAYVSDLPAGYKRGMHLDRIDNDGNYEPGNVRWVTPQVNNSNRRYNRWIEHNGQRKLMSEWAAEVGISQSSMKRRIDDLGWPIERAVTEKRCDMLDNIRRAQLKQWEGHTKKPRPEPRVLKTVCWQGREHTIAELSDMTGVGRNLLRKQLFERNWPIEKVMQKARCANE